MHGLCWCARKQCPAWSSQVTEYSPVLGQCADRDGVSCQQPMLLELATWEMIKCEVIKSISSISFNSLLLSVLAASITIWLQTLKLTHNVMLVFFCVSLIVASVSENCLPFIIPWSLLCIGQLWLCCKLWLHSSGLILHFSVNTQFLFQNHQISVTVLSHIWS